MVYLTNASQGGKRTKIDKLTYDNIETYDSLDVIPVEERVTDRLYFIKSDGIYYRWSESEGFVAISDNNKINLLEQRVSENETGIIYLRGATTLLESNLTNVESNYFQFEAITGTNISTINNKINNINSTISGNTISINNAGIEIENLKTRVTSNTGNIDLINTKLPGMVNNINNNEIMIDNHTIQIAANTSNITTNTGAIAALQIGKEDKITVNTKNLSRNGNVIALNESIALTGNVDCGFVSTNGMTSSDNVNAVLLNAYSVDKNCVMTPNQIQFKENNVVVGTINKATVSSINAKVDNIINTDGYLTVTRNGNTITLANSSIPQINFLLSNLGNTEKITIFPKLCLHNRKTGAIIKTLATTLNHQSYFTSFYVKVNSTVKLLFLDSLFTCTDYTATTNDSEGYIAVTFDNPELVDTYTNNGTYHSDREVPVYVDLFVKADKSHVYKNKWQFFRNTLSLCQGSENYANAGFVLADHSVQSSFCRIRGQMMIV